MVLTRAIFLLIVFLTVGCASTQHAQDIAPEIPQNYAGPDAGYLVVSLGAGPKTQYTSYTLFFHPKFDRLRGKIHYRQESGLFFFPKTDRDFDDSAGNGFVYVHKLPAGEYEINYFNIWRNHGRNQVNYYPKERFSISFIIEPGVATYLGEFLAHGLTGKNFIGMTIPAGAKFVITDKQTRDLPVAQKKYPDIQKIKIAIPESSIENMPLIEKHELL